MLPPIQSSYLTGCTQVSTLMDAISEDFRAIILDLVKEKKHLVCGASVTISSGTKPQLTKSGKKSPLSSPTLKASCSGGKTSKVRWVKPPVTQAVG